MFLLLKKRLINYLLRHLLVAPDLNQVIDIGEMQKGRFKVGGRYLNNQQMRNLQEEERTLRQLELWGLMTNTLAMLAQETMFNRALNIDGQMPGKMILYSTDIQKQIAQSIREAQIVDKQA